MPAPAGDKVEFQGMRDKLLGTGENTELRVVQNRLYSKSGRVELGAFVGSLSIDPFLSARAFGGALGYHFSEYFAVSALGWKASISNSDALTVLEEKQGVTANTNKPSAFYGLEAAWSPLYGKLSLFGKRIIYFDARALVGAGMTSTETGTLPTPFVGIGEQVYLSKSFTLQLDYRLMGYRETVREKTIGSDALGDVVAGPKIRMVGVVTLGVSVLF